MTTATNLKIDGERLWSTLMETARFGATPKGALNPFLYDFEFSLDSIRAYYARETPFSYYQAPREWTFVTTMGAMRLPYFLDHRSPDPHDPLLGRTAYDFDASQWVDYCEIYDRSFYRALLMEAMGTLAVGDYGYSGATGCLWRDAPQADPSWQREVLTVVERMKSLGFELFIDFDGLEYILAADDAWLNIGLDRFNEHLAGYYAVAVFARDPKFAREVEEILADNFGLAKITRY